MGEGIPERYHLAIKSSPYPYGVAAPDASVCTGQPRKTLVPTLTTCLGIFPEALASSSGLPLGGKMSPKTPLG